MAREGPAVDAAVCPMCAPATSMIRMHTIHPSGVLNARSPPPGATFATRDQLDDDVDYQTAYQSARTVAINDVLGCSIAASGPVHYTDRLSMASNKVGKDRSMTTQAQRHRARDSAIRDGNVR